MKTARCMYAVLFLFVCLFAGRPALGHSVSRNGATMRGGQITSLPVADSPMPWPG